MQTLGRLAADRRVELYVAGWKMLIHLSESTGKAVGGKLNLCLFFWLMKINNSEVVWELWTEITIEALCDTSYTFKGIFLATFIVWGSFRSEINGCVFTGLRERATAELRSKAWNTVQNQEKTRIKCYEYVEIEPGISSTRYKTPFLSKLVLLGLYTEPVTLFSFPCFVLCVYLL